MDVVKVVSLQTPYPKVSHLMDENGEILCRLELRFRLLGSRPNDLTRICVPCQNIHNCSFSAGMSEAALLRSELWG